MVATGFSPHSKNRSAGEAIARKGKSPHVSEGMASLPQLIKVLGPRAKAYPLLSALRAVVVGGKKARAVFEGLL
jgi:glycerol-3-phosphate dehydrogenase